MKKKTKKKKKQQQQMNTKDISPFDFFWSRIRCSFQNDTQKKIFKGTTLNQKQSNVDLTTLKRYGDFL